MYQIWIILRSWVVDCGLSYWMVEIFSDELRHESLTCHGIIVNVETSMHEQIVHPTAQHVRQRVVYWRGRGRRSKPINGTIQRFIAASHLLNRGIYLFAWDSRLGRILL